MAWPLKYLCFICSIFFGSKDLMSATSAVDSSSRDVQQFVLPGFSQLSNSTTHLAPPDFTIYGCARILWKHPNECVFSGISPSLATGGNQMVVYGWC
jgi:hypothetical protein